MRRVISRQRCDPRDFSFAKEACRFAIVRARQEDGSGGLGPAILRAYDATNLGTTLYASNKSSADTCGNAGKFTLPVVANGHVYVVGTGALTVYGLAP